MATAPGMASDSRVPSITFQGCSPSPRGSEPIMKIGVLPPDGVRHCAKPITSGAAEATPSTDERAKALALVEQGRILEAFGAARHDPEVGVGMVDHDRDHALEAHIETHLHGHQHDREHDADDGRDQPQPIVNQVPEREFGGERHDLGFERPIRRQLSLRRFCKRARLGADEAGAERNVAQGRDHRPARRDRNGEHERGLHDRGQRRVQ